MKRDIDEVYDDFWYIVWELECRKAEIYELKNKLELAQAKLTAYEHRIKN